MKGIMFYSGFGSRFLPFLQYQINRICIMNREKKADILKPKQLYYTVIHTNSGLLPLHSFNGVWPCYYQHLNLRWTSVGMCETNFTVPKDTNIETYWNGEMITGQRTDWPALYLSQPDAVKSITVLCLACLHSRPTDNSEKTELERWVSSVIERPTKSSCWSIKLAEIICSMRMFEALKRR